MGSINESLDLKIFSACKISEYTQVVLKRPVACLLMGQVGAGKSTAISLFAKMNNYELVMLRGNSTSPEVVQGFDVAPTNTDSVKSTKHLRPTWFQNVLDNHDNGKKTLLFLDEISTANEWVQGSLLQLILERKCDEEHLPEDTLVIAAANYSNNLSNTMTMLPPLMNRFMIINILPNQRDVSDFLSLYKGSITGSKVSYEDKYKEFFDTVNLNLSKEVDESFINKAGEMIEQALVNQAVSLCKDKKLDLSCTDLKNIYSDTEGKSELPGFVTLRSLNFARDVALSSYMIFGQYGLKSDNFKEQLRGLVGLCLSYTTNGDVKKYDSTVNFFTAMVNVSEDIEKMNNEVLPQYNDFFRTILKSSKQYLTVDEMNLISEKINDMMKEERLKNIDRPVDPVFIVEFIKRASNSVGEVAKYGNNKSTSNKKISATAIDISNEASKDPSKYAGVINYLNNIVKLIKTMNSVVNNPKKRYDQSIVEKLNTLTNECRHEIFNIGLVKKYMKGSNDKSFVS